MSEAFGPQWKYETDDQKKIISKMKIIINTNVSECDSWPILS
jgi:hypothetical protein